MLEKLKSFLQNDQLFFATIVVLVGIVSFSLGRASVADLTLQKAEVSNQGTGVVIKNDAIKKVAEELQTDSTPVVRPEAGMLVGSKSGTKYHLTSCPGAKQIKEENKIYFTDSNEAEAAGYKPAANCPQLQ